MTIEAQFAAFMLALAGLGVGWLCGVVADRLWPIAMTGAGPLPRHSRSRYRAPLTGGLTGAVLFLALGSTLSPGTVAAAWLFYAASGILLTLIDLRHRLLPNRVLVPVFLGGVILLCVASAVSGDWVALGRAAGGAAALFAVYLVLALISPQGMGMGDVKFAAVVGLFLAYLGWGTLLMGALAGFVIGALVGVLLLLLRRGSTVPYGPAMFAGSVAAALLAAAAAPGLLSAVGT